MDGAVMRSPTVRRELNSQLVKWPVTWDCVECVRRACDVRTTCA